MLFFFDEDFVVLKVDIVECGVLVFVEYDEEGNMFDGYYCV